MADRQPLVGPAEDHLGGDDEAREPHGVDLGTADGHAAGLLGPMELAERVPELGLTDLAEALRELARRPARDVGLAGVRIVDDLPVRRDDAPPGARPPGTSQRSGRSSRTRQRRPALAGRRRSRRNRSAVRPEVPIDDGDAASIAARALRLDGRGGRVVDEHVDAVERLRDARIHGDAGAPPPSASARSRAAADRLTAEVEVEIGSLEHRRNERAPRPTGRTRNAHGDGPGHRNGYRASINSTRWESGK